ncbi:putative membrane protein [Wolbachia endosymbiont of Culex quinquefasciatus JHB]|uniref:hypothetical protein n=1 Tax=Wolbachia endosymbiont of Culex quinquefasciatus TaxID=263437 RepID=UPI0001761F03|nr:hypothetical protein [Wolbachia endosymbiont of Culex quinquefasciatus]EEB56187.1 putative membrane protein [Wolbachia endosymbiont of Culex quinquefasciatus JHB]CAQ54902.1 putative membrane protein [Wolbachia endosymbiont of Culex quinquefasciatus Pel]
MNIKERKDFQQELLGIVFNILVENEDSTIETMETRAVEIIKKLKEHINDDIEYGGQKKPILDWVIVCDSQNNVRLNNKSLLKFEKAIKDIRGRAPLNEIESIIRLLVEQAQLNHVRIRGEREVPLNLFEENIIMRERRRAREQQMRPNFVREREASLNLSGNRSENIRRPGEQMQPSEVSLNLSENRDEYTIMRERRRAGRRMRPNFVRREREVPLSSKIGQLIGVVSSIIVGAFIGIMVGMVIAGLCIELCVITTAEPILLIMGATAVIGAIVAGTAPVLKLIEMQEPNLSPSSGLESSNTEHTYLNRQRVI